MSIKILGVHVSNPNEAFSVMHLTFDNPSLSNISYMSAVPIQFGEWIVPEQIVCEFLLQALHARVKAVWKVKVTILIEDRLPAPIPLTKEISISVLGKSYVPNVKLSDRIENSYLSFTSAELHELEHLAISTVVRRWSYDAGAWVELAEGYISEREFIAIRKEVLKRTSYRTLDDQFLKEVARLFHEAEKKGERTNIYIANEIGRRENRLRTAKTSEKWVAEARKRGFLEPASRKKNSSRRKSVGEKATKKATPKKKGTK